MKISKKWRKISEIYKKFLEKDWEVDLSEDAALEMYLFESFGQGKPSNKNGYYLGKKWMEFGFTRQKMQRPITA